ncbi:MAG: [FeFe] hydrogenase H-cluster radical SAM maturase HydG [Desulfovibrio sp.]|nr:[FeFe] hydrogenase H-cluster radical SAM maturase HydG [Desulfovibrio sp.]
MDKEKVATDTPKVGEVWFSPNSRAGRNQPKPPTGAKLWFRPSLIEEVLQRNNPPDDHELSDILAKSKELTSLNSKEIVALMRVHSPDQLETMLSTAFEVKQKVYGDRVVLSAPLHIANYCGSECLYCANRKSNTTIERHYMNLKEMRESGLKLARQGHKRVFLVTGQLPNADIEYLVDAIRVFYSIFEGKDEIRRVNVNVGPLDADDYAVLQQADVGTVLLYQDTYHEEAYHRAHPAGPKSDYTSRLNAPETALQSGIFDTGLGLVLGLGPWQFDILALARHADYLLQNYGTGGRTVSMHRLRPAPGCHFSTPYPVSDSEYLRCVAIVRLAIPYTGIILTSKEPANLWRDGCSVGASQILTGSVANPYSTWNDGPDKVPFPLGEECHVEEVVRFLLEDARQLPSFCTACPRIGRQGSLFTSMVREGEMKNQCGPNSMSTFLEYLLHYASAETKRLGLRLIDDKLAEMPELTRRRAKILLDGIKRGKNDEFV